MTSISRPLVAVTATTAILRNQERARVNVAYIEAIEQAGLIPLATPPLADLSLAGDLLDRIDGLVLTGGEDVDPRHYGAAPHAATESPHVLRDAWELALVEEARRRRLPVLAICRGMQLLNVALGGSLIQDLPTQHGGEVQHARAAARGERVHGALLEPGSRWAKVIGATSIRINSSHHQAIDRVATGLRVVATSEDGVIEAIETVDERWWVLGAQWHPEELVRTPEPWDRNLFAAYAAEVRRRAATHGAGVAVPRRLAV